MKSSRGMWVWLFIVAVTLTLSGSLCAQTQITGGVIQGTVVDQTGAAIPGAAVEAKNVGTNLTKTQSSGPDGRFTFLLLPSGRYTLTASHAGFTTVVQENLDLSVGQALTVSPALKVSTTGERVVVSATATAVDTTETASTSNINERSVSSLPVLGRKFEDLLTLTPGVAITQGPDGDEINFNGQRGVFNNISLDGGDYNNGFFGEQLGGQRAAIDITLDAVKEFQVVASGANAEFGRTAGGVVNVITKSGTNDTHGTVFYYQRMEALTANTSDGKPLKDFKREQFGGTIGGPIKKDKLFIFGAFEQILEDLTRPNLSAALGTCPVATPVVGTNDGIIGSNSECQRLALLNFLKNSVGQDDGQPVKHPIRNSSALGRFDWNVTPKNQFSVSYNFDYSKNTNQTFDVGTYGTSANGIEGPSKINNINVNNYTTVSTNKLNEAHFSFQREDRPRLATPSKIPADTAMGFVTTFRVGAPFFLEPKVDETIWRAQIRDSFSIVSGKHNFKFGGDWLHTSNSQTFRGFFTGRYIFDSVDGFLRYASPAAANGFGPTVGECSDGTWITQGAPFSQKCAGTATVGGPLIFYLQDGVPTGLVNVPPGASAIKNEDLALFVQDKWQITPRFSLSYGLRWEAQIFPVTVVAPSKTAYGIFLSDPLFPSDGTLHSQKKEIQPRIGFAWDVAGNQKSVLRASVGIFNGRQNMLSQVGSITTNGVQQSTIFTQSSFGGGPTWPNSFPTTPTTGSCTSGTVTNPFACFTGVRVFDKHYKNPRIYTTNFAYEQEVVQNWTAYADFTWSKGVLLTSFIEANSAGGGYFADNGTFIPPGRYAPFLDSLFVTTSTGKSLYRGLTIGMRKRFSQRFSLDWNYVLSEDLDNDSNERDPFTDRRLNPQNPALNYSFSDRDERHKFNLFSSSELPGGINLNLRLQAHTPQPLNAGTKRNQQWKDNEFISFDWRVSRPFKFSDRYSIVPTLEVFNTFNNKNNVNPLSTPALFNFDGFLRLGVGDPRQAQLAVKFIF
jgi:hypothetical protein